MSYAALIHLAVANQRAPVESVPVTNDGGSSDDEPGLVVASRAGSHTAFATLVERHEEAVRSYIASHVSTSGAIDDLAQETFIHAFGSLQRYRGDSPLRHWLLGVARHRTLQHLRAELRRRKRETDLVGASVAERHLDLLEQDGEHLAMRARELGTLADCLDRLPGKSMEIVTRHYFQAHTLAEIAREAGRSEESVRVEILRIRRAVRRCMDDKITAGTA